MLRPLAVPNFAVPLPVVPNGYGRYVAAAAASKVAEAGRDSYARIAGGRGTSGQPWQESGPPSHLLSAGENRRDVDWPLRLLLSRYQKAPLLPVGLLCPRPLLLSGFLLPLLPGRREKRNTPRPTQPRGGQVALCGTSALRNMMQRTRYYGFCPASRMPTESAWPWKLLATSAEKLARSTECLRKPPVIFGIANTGGAVRWADSGSVNQAD